MSKPKKTAMVVLREFFGYRPGEGLKQFSEEVNQLTIEERKELAALAADELGYELVEAAK